jgi:hypothetical protein
VATAERPVSRARHAVRLGWPCRFEEEVDEVEAVRGEQDLLDEVAAGWWACLIS